MGEANEPTNSELAKIFDLARRTALANGADHGDADEVAQRVTVKLWEHWSAIHIQQAHARGPGGWRSYVIVSARNGLRDLARSESRLAARQLRALTMAGSMPMLSQRPGVLGGEPQDPAEIETLLAREMILAEVLRLSGRRRQVATWVILLEMSIAETAEALGLAPRTVRQHLQGATLQLARRIKRQHSD